ncbi:hypothetical protein TSUD_247310 [Trifolium subterraneum]|uniref:Granulins domain-containing protein n=1 Tax=Trifolium subterraneum TaxID=3900 RepID=A0A2Z6P9R7_TRISU|nr:hypothetical protein TSUD_247300 [Trifolium subterraneum]GAU45723.1 hypothetical protein TSUD_247310 [Trifolium subterraneum]
MLMMFLKFVVFLVAIAGALVGNVHANSQCCERGEICDLPPCKRGQRICCEPPTSNQMKP